MSIKEIIVEKDFINMRLERFLSKKTGLPKQYFLKLIRQKKLKINGINGNIGQRMQFGDKIHFKIVFDIITKQIEISDLNQFNFLKNRIFFENNFYLALNKPININSQDSYDYNLNKFINEYGYDSIQEPYKLLHRLDFNTSGVFIAAKNNYFAQKFSAQLMNHEIAKIYVCVLDGLLYKDTIIEQPILKLENGFCEINSQGKYAKTIFVPIARTKHYTLCLVKPITGRTHQIRMHALWMNKPVLGDNKYHVSHNRMFLHSLLMCFNRTIHIARLDQNFSQILRSFSILEEELINQSISLLNSFNNLEKTD